jgi:endonuclease/exonuclease/phosphatase family metal-dependent hydrolase
LQADFQTLDADVICLQESFRTGNRRRLVEALSDRYHFPGTYDSRSIIPGIRSDTTGGLVILSKYPFIDYAFCSHHSGRGMKLSEAFGRKGFILSKIATPFGPLVIANMHLYAGRAESDAKFRLEQIPYLLEQIDSYRGHCPVILAGDLNSSPCEPFPAKAAGELLREYELVLQSGFVDVLKTCDHSTVTYASPGNRYAEMWYQETKTPQRYDYIFTKPSTRRITSLEARVVLNSHQPVSDHYGLFAEISISK